jgi:methyl-accepting chemotaxis protein
VTGVFHGDLAVPQWACVEMSSVSLDLAHRAPDLRRDEMGRIARAFNFLLTRIEREISAVKQVAEKMRAATREIVAGNTDLSARTEQQAAALQETAASVGELAGTVRHNADDAREVNTLANDAADLARVGDTAMLRLTATIERVGECAGKFSEITGIIEAIAFQTNMLVFGTARGASHPLALRVRRMDRLCGQDPARDRANLLRSNSSGQGRSAAVGGRHVVG